MILFPAIDIKNGSCVRLVQGKMENATIFNEDPVEQARFFESKGCKWIHIVDLDGAIKGESVNKEIIKKITSSVNVKIQLGGGIRNIQEKDLHIKYETACDPRLNHEQSIELAFLITDLIKKKR